MESESGLSFVETEREDVQRWRDDCGKRENVWCYVKYVKMKILCLQFSEFYILLFRYLRPINKNKCPKSGVFIG